MVSRPTSQLKLHQIVFTTENLAKSNRIMWEIVEETQDAQRETILLHYFLFV